MEDVAATRSSSAPKARDLVIFDAMYSLAEKHRVAQGRTGDIRARDRRELLPDGEAKHLCLFHHEPIFDDARIAKILEETIRLEEITRNGPPLRISSAHDGLVIEV